MTRRALLEHAEIYYRPVAKALRPVYTAPTEADAAERFLENLLVITPSRVRAPRDPSGRSPSC